MEDLQLALTTARVDQRNFGLWISNWQIGQSLNALVTGQLPSGDLVLRVGGQQITATSDIPIQQGAQLRLEVKQLEPGPTLRVLNVTPGPEPAAGVNATLRLLPSLRGDVATVPAGSLLQTLQTAQAALPLPPPLAASLDALLRLASRSERIGSAGGLAQAVKDSGVFLERRLADAGTSTPRAALEGDFKAGVLRALAQAQVAIEGVKAGRLNAGDAQALSDLRRELEVGLGRITLNQLATQAGDSSVRAWQLEIPVYHAAAFHTVSLRVERDGGGEHGSTQSGDDEAAWRVQLELAPPALGAVHIDLKVRDSRLTLALAAERGPTRALLDGGMDQLAKTLAARGIALEATPARRLATRDAAGPARTAGDGVDLRA